MLIYCCVGAGCCCGKIPGFDTVFGNNPSFWPHLVVVVVVFLGFKRKLVVFVLIAISESYSLKVAPLATVPTSPNRASACLFLW